MIEKGGASEFSFISSSMYTYLKTTLTENVFTKLIVGSIAFTFGTIYEEFTLPLGSIIVLYFVDFFLGILCALKKRDFESKRFFSGGVKGFVYMLLMYICFSVDQTLHTGTGFTWFIITFMVLRDSISILENLEFLGIKTPIGLTKYLKYRAGNIIKEFEDKK